MFGARVLDSRPETAGIQPFRRTLDITTSDFFRHWCSWIHVRNDLRLPGSPERGSTFRRSDPSTRHPGPAKTREGRPLPSSPFGFLPPLRFHRYQLPNRQHPNLSPCRAPSFTFNKFSVASLSIIVGLSRKIYSSSTIHPSPSPLSSPSTSSPRGSQAPSRTSSNSPGSSPAPPGSP